LGTGLNMNACWVVWAVGQKREDDDAMARRALERGRLAYECLVMDMPVNMEQKCALVRGMAKKWWSSASNSNGMTMTVTVGSHTLAEGQAHTTQVQPRTMHSTYALPPLPPYLPQAEVLSPPAPAVCAASCVQAYCAEGRGEVSQANRGKNQEATGAARLAHDGARLGNRGIACEGNLAGYGDLAFIFPSLGFVPPRNARIHLSLSPRKRPSEWPCLPLSLRCRQRWCLYLVRRLRARRHTHKSHYHHPTPQATTAT